MNKTMSKPACPARRASVLIAFLVAFVLMQLIAMAILFSGARDAELSSRGTDGLRAQYAADSGLAMAMREVKKAADEDTDGTIGSISNDAIAANDPNINGGYASVSAAKVGNDTTLTVQGYTAATSRRTTAVVRSASTATGLLPGVLVECWALASAPSTLASVSWNSTPTAIGTLSDVNMPNANGQRRWTGGPGSRYALRFTAKINIPTAGLWTFYTTSDDGSDLWINGVRVVNNDGLHGSTQRSGTVTLTAGVHDFVVRFFENTGGSQVIASWQAPGAGAASIIPASAFTFDPAPLAHSAVHATTAINGDSTASASTVDAYNSARGSYGGSNVLSTGVLAINATSASAWQMTDLATLKGFARVGVGGNPASVIALYNGASITGGSSAQTSASALMQQTAPTLTSSGAFANGGTFTLSTNTRYSSYQLWGTSSTLTISGNVVLVVDGDFSLSNAPQIIIPAGSSLTLYVGGNVNIWNQSVVNGSGSPDRCTIVLTGASSQFNMTDQAVCVARVQGWTASANLYGTNGAGTDFSGSLRVNSLQMTGKARLHLDTVSVSNAGSGAFSLVSWSDVP